MARVEISNKFICKESNLEDDTVILYHHSSQNFIIELSYFKLFPLLSKYQQNKIKKLKRDIELEIVINLDFDTVNKALKNMQI
ncbi:hypothetical protein ACOTVZ_03170 [Aliarcobacter butzleri]